MTATEAVLPGRVQEAPGELVESRPARAVGLVGERRPAKAVALEKRLEMACALRYSSLVLVDPLLIPVIRTDRLVLRGWRDTDLDAHAAMCADSQVMRFLGGPLDRFGSWRRMATHAGHWSLRGFGNWVIVRLADDSILGHAGLWQPDGWPGIEVSWTLCRDAWGHGYATEAGRVAIEWAWANLDTDRLISVIAPANVASIRLAGRLGMHHDGDTELLGKMMAVWALDRPAPKGR